ncbi:MAG: diphthine--ammonia ligase [Nanoarchaeota archaeon]|nr:diphthine--ammonia ligase [Nanoarchaeota archaeon]
MKLAALFSGGKDSTYVVHRALQDGHDVVRLISFAPKNPDSYMFHHPNIHLTNLLAQALTIPQTVVPTAGKKEHELQDLEQALRILKGIDGVAAGALASRYQHDRVTMICKKLGLAVYAPVWQQDPEAYVRTLGDEGFVYCLTKVACEGLGKEWLGKTIDKTTIDALLALSKKFRFHPAGEGGEYESLVLDCPVFKKQLVIDDAATTWDGETGTYLVKRAHLQAKPA